MTRFIDGVSSIAAQYDLFVLDQWGVLHDGTPAKPYVIDTLQQLKTLGKQIVILSNSGRAADFSRARMGELGIGADMYDHLLTSGEMVRQGLLRRDAAPFDAMGRHVYLIPDRADDPMLADTIFSQVPPAQAEAILLLGALKSHDMAALAEQLRPLAARAAPLIAANPDWEIVDATGVYPGPGQIADMYHKMGGPVWLFGKPHAPAYDAIKRMYPDVPAARTIMVGDSYGHDITGGAGAGMATLLCRAGVHADAFAAQGDEATLRALAAAHDNIMPDFVIDRFAW